jgi:HSP20 family protein
MFGSLTGFPSSLFDEFWRLQQEMIEEFLSDGAGSGGIRSLPRGSFPAINVLNTADTVQVYLFAPGIDSKALNVSLQQNLLTVEGKRAIPLEEKATYYRQERFGGDFRRVISLPEDVDPERIEAKYREGIVQVIVQRQPSAKPRQIEIH